MSGTRGMPQVRAVIALVVVLGLVVVGLSGLSSAGAAAAAAQTGPGAATTEAEAQEQARESGQRVEIKAFRGEAHEIYANPDGTRTRVQHFQPVRTFQDGTWVSTDPTLVRRDDGAIVPKAAAVGMVFSGGGDEAPMARMIRAGRSMALHWPGELPEPTLDGDTATYAEVLPGVDLEIRADVDGFSHLLVVKSAQAADNPTLAEIDFEVRVDGVEVAEAPSGGLTAADAEVGGPVFETPVPRMWDSGDSAGTRVVDQGEAGPTRDGSRGPLESSRLAEVGVGVEEVAGQSSAGSDAQTLTLRPDQDLLTGAETAYPVYIDPVWKTSSLTGWGQVSSAHPNNTYWKFGSYDEGGVGRCGWDSCGSSHVRRTFFRIYTKPYAGTEILEATFTAKAVWSAHRCTKEPVELWRTQFYGSGRTWNNQPGWKDKLDTRWTAKGGSSNCPQGPVEFNAKPALTKAAGGGWKNLSFGLRAKNESAKYQWKKFDNNGTHVSVRYTTPPKRPKQSELSMDPGGACVYGSDRPFVDEKPRLHAIIRDPDNGQGHTETVRARFAVFWQDGSGNTVTKYHNTSYKAAGSNFSFKVPYNIPENKVIAWRVRGYDGEAYGPWSWQGSQSRCQFVYDTTAPAEPSVSSGDYPDDGGAHDGVGVYGSFTFDSPSPDVVKYRYGINNNPSPANEIAADSQGGPATLEWMPKRSGPQWITVRSVDQAGQVSTTATYYFNVSAGRGPVAHWKLDEQAGATEAADTTGNHPATPGSAVTFGADGPASSGDRAVSLDGTGGGGYLATDEPVVNTSESYSVSAWVRLESDDNHYHAASQSGQAQSGFQLGYSNGTDSWIFKRPASDDVGGSGPWEGAHGDNPPQLNVWTHLVGVYDATAQRLRLYVNGDLVGSNDDVSAWNATGGFQIGRAIFDGEYQQGWLGDIADVRTFDRIVVADEAHALFQLPPQRVGYWQLNDAQNGGSVPSPIGHWALDEQPGAAQAADSVGGQSATPGGGATFGETGPTDGADLAVHLDGSAAGYLATDGPVVDTAASFSVAAWVRLTASGKHYNAVSQSGDIQSGFQLGYSTGSGSWVMKRPSSDTGSGGGAWHGAAASEASEFNTWTHLVGVYDASADELKLYVNGELAGTHGEVPAFGTGGGFQIGRSIFDGSYHNQWPGDVADVRAFDHAVSDQEAAALYSGGNPTSGEYAGTASALVLAGDSDVFTGSPLEPALVGSGHVELDGTGDFARSAAPVAGTDKSFTVSARVRLSSPTPGASMAVASQAGVIQSGFVLRYAESQQLWQVEMSHADVASPQSTAVTNTHVAPTAQQSGQHLALVYDAFHEELRLYVDGELAGATAYHPDSWQATGALQLGRALIDGSWGQDFAGVVDDVRIYAGVADQELVQKLAVQQEQPNL